MYYGKISTAVCFHPFKSVLYKTVNNVVSANERLHRIGLSVKDLCVRCYLVDTVPHRFTCGDRVYFWKWIREKIALLSRTSDDCVEPTVFYRPDKHYHPQWKTNAIMWLTGQYNSYVINKLGGDSIIEFVTHMETEYVKLCNYKDHKKKFQNAFHTIFNRTGIF